MIWNAIPQTYIHRNKVRNSCRMGNCSRLLWCSKSTETLLLIYLFSYKRQWNKVFCTSSKLRGFPTCNIRKSLLHVFSLRMNYFKAFCFVVTGGHYSNDSYFVMTNLSLSQWCRSQSCQLHFVQLSFKWTIYYFLNCILQCGNAARYLLSEIISNR